MNTGDACWSTTISHAGVTHTGVEAWIEVGTPLKGLPRVQKC